MDEYKRARATEVRAGEGFSASVFVTLEVDGDPVKVHFYNQDAVSLGEQLLCRAEEALKTTREAMRKPQE